MSTHADLAGQQQPENPQPGRVGERLEEPFHLIQGFGHIFALTNIARPRYRLYIRLSEYKRSGCDVRYQQVVRQKYGAIATAVKEASAAPDGRVLRTDGLRRRRPDHLEPLLRRRDPRPPGRRGVRVARLRQPDGAHRARAGPDGPGSRVGRRHRRAALGQARRADRQGLWPRHDRRDARPGAREPAQGGRDERRVPEGHDRVDSAARSTRWTSSSPTASSTCRATRTPSCAKPSGCSNRAAASRCPTWSCAARCRPRSGAAWSSGSAASRGRSRNASTPRSSRPPASRTSRSSRGASTRSTTRAPF